MNDLNALLRAIITNPDDDTVRLAYADALDELPDVSVQCLHCAEFRYPGKTPDDLNLRNPTWLNCDQCEGTAMITDESNHERAEFIRVQIERGSLENSDPKTFFISDMDRLNWLKKRTTELLREGYFRWSSLGDEFHKRVHQAVWYRRGFIEKLTCPSEDFFKHAALLLWHPKQVVKNKSTGRISRQCPDTAQPIKKVVLTTVPYSSGRSDFAPLPLSWFQQKWPGIEFQLEPLNAVELHSVSVQLPDGVLTMEARESIRPGDVVYADREGRAVTPSRGALGPDFYYMGRAVENVPSTIRYINPHDGSPQAEWWLRRNPAFRHPSEGIE